MVSDVSMGNANLMTAVNTSVLKKSMDTNEALMNELIEGMEGVSQASAPQASSSNILRTSLRTFWYLGLVFLNNYFFSIFSL